MSRVYIAYVDCTRAGGEPTDRGGLHPRRQRLPLRRPQRRLLRPAGPRLGRDVITSRRQPDQHPPGVLVAVQEGAARFVEDQLAKFATAKNQAVESGLGGAVAAPAATPPAPAQSFDIAKFAGIFAALGLAFGAVGGAVASVVTGLLRLPPWQIPIAVAAALLLISGPAMLLAALKLRQRNLGPFLEGTGWAVNGRVKINIALGAALTDRAVLPENSSACRAIHSRTRPRSAGRLLYVAVVLMVFVWAMVALVYRAWRY